MESSEKVNSQCAGLQSLVEIACLEHAGLMHDGVRTRDLVPWLRQNAQIIITGKDIRNWAFRGKFKAVETKPSPTYNPHEVLDAWYETRRDESRT